MVAVSDFSGLVSSTWALARAAAMVAIVSPERCMAVLHAQDIKAHRPGFRALGSDSVSDRIFGVLRHEAFELRLGILVLEVGPSGAPKDVGEFRPSIG